MMVISTYLILKKAPFSKVAKIALILTVPMMYQYVIVGRSYSLIVLLITLICVLDNNRKEHPILYGILLALLTNTHLIMVGLVIMITITFYLYELIINRKNNTKEENIKILKGFLIVVFGGVLLLIQLIGCITVSSGISREINVSELLITTISNLNILANALISANNSKYIVYIIFLIFLSVGIWDFRRETIVFIGAALFQALIYSILGLVESYMAMSIIFLLMYSMWSKSNEINKNNGNKKIIIMFEIILIIISAMSIPKIVKTMKNDYKYNYSSAKEMAEYINNLEEGSIYIADKDAQCSSIIPYINNNAKFWNIRTEKYYTYITWDMEREKEITVEEVEQQLKQEFTDKDNLYYIYCPLRNDQIKLYLEENGELSELYKTEASYTDETFILYKIDLK
jgi:hypothetical protein